MPQNGTIAYVSRIPKCDVHEGKHDAVYDALVFVKKQQRRTWAFVCEDAFREGHGHLGMGRGQILIKRGGE